LLLDPVSPTAAATGERHHRLRHRGISVAGLDFERGGELLAIRYGDEIVIESMPSGTEQPGGCAADDVFQFTFTDPEHILLLGRTQARICAWRTGQMVATLELSNTSRARIHPTAPGAGEIGVRKYEVIDDEDKITLLHTSYANNQFTALEPLAKSDFERWPELGDEWGVVACNAGNHYLATDENTRKLVIQRASGERSDFTIVEAGADEVDIEQIEPSPDGRFLAIVTQPGSEEYGYSHYYGGFESGDRETLSIWAATSDPPELRWSTTISDSRVELAWTDDGSRLAIEDGGRLRVIAIDGEVLLDRGSREFQLEELPDDPTATAQPSATSPR
jgi:hypothetical protein